MGTFHWIESSKYYETPPDAVFDDIKKNAIAIWETYDDTYDYAGSKIRSISHLENVRDNVWFITGLFDNINQQKLWEMIDQSTRDFVDSIKVKPVAQPKRIGKLKSKHFKICVVCGAPANHLTWAGYWCDNHWSVTDEAYD